MPSPIYSGVDKSGTPLYTNDPAYAPQGPSTPDTLVSFFDAKGNRLSQDQMDAYSNEAMIHNGMMRDPGDPAGTASAHKALSDIDANESSIASAPLDPEQAKLMESLQPANHDTSDAFANMVYHYAPLGASLAAGAVMPELLPAAAALGPVVKGGLVGGVLGGGEEAIRSGGDIGRTLKGAGIGALGGVAGEVGLKALSKTSLMKTILRKVAGLAPGAEATAEEAPAATFGDESWKNTARTGRWSTPDPRGSAGGFEPHPYTPPEEPITDQFRPNKPGAQGGSVPPAPGESIIEHPFQPAEPGEVSSFHPNKPGNTSAPIPSNAPGDAGAIRDELNYIDSLKKAGFSDQVIRNLSKGDLERAIGEHTASSVGLQNAAAEIPEPVPAPVPEPVPARQVSLGESIANDTGRGAKAAEMGARARAGQAGVMNEGIYGDVVPRSGPQPDVLNRHKAAMERSRDNELPNWSADFRKHIINTRDQLRKESAAALRRAAAEGVK